MFLDMQIYLTHLFDTARYFLDAAHALANPGLDSKAWLTMFGSLPSKNFAVLDMLLACVP